MADRLMRRRRRGLRAAGVLAVVVLVAGGAGTAYATMGHSGPAYRLATARVADVTATLSAVGTVTPVSEASVAFPVSGTVATVVVAAGQHVRAGQPLGSLDTTQLQAKLTGAESALALAQLTVANDRTALAAAASPTPTPTAAAAPRGGVAGSADRAEQQLTAAVRRLQADAAAAARLCGVATPTPPATGSPGSSPTPSPTLSAAPAAERGPRPVPTSAPTSSGTDSCADATAAMSGDAGAVAQAQRAIEQALTATEQATRTAVTTTGSQRSAASSHVTAAQLTADEAAADAAAAQVTVAEQDLTQARPVSPIAGTVVSVAVAPGSSAGPGSTAFVVAALHGFEVVADVDVAKVPSLAVGQPVTVHPDGAAALTGSVAAIGLLPVSGSAYPVTIALTGDTSGLRAGVDADVTITVQRAHGVAVPSSAVRGVGTAGVVSVYSAGTVTATRVAVGTRGPALTEITSGLTAGQQVVLARLDQPLPSNTDLRLGRLAGGGLGGGGAASFRGGRGSRG